VKTSELEEIFSVPWIQRLLLAVIVLDGWKGLDSLSLTGLEVFALLPVLRKLEPDGKKTAEAFSGG
jgi:hypothetical protein